MKNNSFLTQSYALLVLTIMVTGLQSLQAQGIISGKVLSESTGKPLSGASVYINSSTIGTTTNEAGEYRLPVSGNGFYDVVASYVGYEIIVYRATIQSKNIQVTFKLQEKPTELRNVVVLSKEGRARRLKILREQFLGITEAAEKTKIENEEEILFTDAAGKDVVGAFSVVPLEIVNKELGYRIFFQLEDFYYNNAEGRTYFYGYSRFEELKEKGKIPARYLRNRDRYYRGSTLHFYHSLIDDKVKEEGFLLLHIQAMKNTGEEPGKATTIDSSSRTGFKVKMSGKMNIGSPIVPSQFFKKDTLNGNNVYIMDWVEKLRVTYSKDPYPKKYLKQKIMLSGNLPVGVYSDVDMLERPAVMDANGSLYNPLAVQMDGYWAYEKLASMLPINYRPR